MHSFLQNMVSIAGILVALVACVTLVIGIFKYSIQVKQNRVQYLFNILKLLKRDEIFKNINAQLIPENKSNELNKIPIIDRCNYLWIFEEIAVMKNSGLIKPDVAFYMFGYYAVKCWNNTLFWENLEKEDKYWSLFNKFAKEAEEYEKSGKKINTKVIRI